MTRLKALYSPLPKIETGLVHVIALIWILAEDILNCV